LLFLCSFMWCFVRINVFINVSRLYTYHFLRNSIWMFCGPGGSESEVFVEVVYANTKKAEKQSSAVTRDGRPPLMPKPQIKFTKKDAASDDGHAVPVAQMRGAAEDQRPTHEQHQAQQRAYLQLVDRDSNVSKNICDV